MTSNRAAAGFRWLASGSRKLAALSALTLALPAVAQERPNIVLFVGDDLGAVDTEPYGNRVVRTPHLARLAAEGLTFQRAYATSPTCAPSRASIYSGLLPFRHGAHANHSMARAGVRSLPHYLGELGYRVAIAGKLHVGPETAYPFERVAGSNVPEPEARGQGALFADLHMPAVDAWLGTVDRSRPWMLVVADHSPHVVWPDSATYDPARVDVPPYHIDTPEYRAARARYYTDVTKMDGNLGATLEALRRRGFADNTVVVFTADQGPQFPFGKWGVYELGIRAPLVVRWPGTVRPAGRTDAMVSLVDLLPTLVEAAGGRAPEGIDGRSFLGVLRGRQAQHRDTVWASHTGDRAMNRVPMRMLRTDRWKYIRNLADTVYTTHMDRVLERNQMYWASWLDRSFRDASAAAILWRYHRRPTEELYDLAADPLERHNLAALPEHAPTLTALRARLDAWRTAQGDTEKASEPLDERPGPGPPYLF